jgi:hypothetical protein
VNAFTQLLEEEYGPLPARPVGRVVGLSGKRVLIDQDAHAEEMPQPGDLLKIDGEAPVIVRLSGFEIAQFGEESAILYEAEVLGRLEDDGRYTASQAVIPPDAEVFPFDAGEALAAQLRTMRYPLPIGSAGTDRPVHLDAERLFTEGAVLVGEKGSGRSATLAVIIRSMLRERIPARVVLVDRDNVFAPSFGTAADIVEAGSGLVPLGLLSEEELRSALQIATGALNPSESVHLPRIRAEALRRGGRVAHFVAAAEHLDAMGIAGRIRDAAADPRLGVFFGRGADNLTAQGVMQKIFRLPNGQPPMAVLQLGGLSPAMADLVTGVVARLSCDVALASRGTIPVLLAIDGSDERLPPAYKEAAKARGNGFGLLPSRERPEGNEAILLQHKAHPGTGARLQALHIEPGEAILIDSSLPGPVVFGVTPLPERSLPFSSESGAGQNDQGDLMAAIAAAWSGVPVA